MIIDTIKNRSLYYSVHKNMEKAFAFIEKAVQEKLPVGKYEIEGKDLYASVQEYETKEEALAKYEGHRKYIDIQYIDEGAEAVEIVDIASTQAITEYNEEKDVLFFTPNSKTWKGVLSAGEYGIFYPNDIHRPAMRVDGVAKKVRKILIKIKL